MSKKKLERLFAVCRELGWNVMPDKSCVELGKYSPAGEDFIFDVRTENFVEDVRDCYESFSPDDHAHEWYGQHRGEPSSLRALLDDAEAIDAELEKLADALEEV